MKRRNENRRIGGRGDGKTRAVVVVIVVFFALISGIYFGFDKLRDLWLQQCVIHNMSEQVHVRAGIMVKGDVIAESFGLRKGANLALIDFDSKRMDVLAKIPNLKSISVIRRLPDQVAITTEEREPIARIGYVGHRTETGKVADIEGVVFYCQRGTRMLPVIREATHAGTAVGRQTGPRTFAALQVVEACRDPEYQEFGLQDIDVTPTDYLMLTFAGTNNARVKFAWAGMDEEVTPESRANLQRQLRHLREAIRAKLDGGTVIWNATDLSTPGRIYADTKGKL